jgi:O-antigen ligase
VHGRLNTAPPPALLAAAGGAVAAVAMLGAYRTSPAAAVVALMAVAATGVALVRPLAVVFAAILLIPLDLFAVPVGSVGVTATEGLFALAGLGWAVRCFVDGRSPLARTPLDAPVVLLLLSIIPGLAIAVDPFATGRVLVLWTLFALVFSLVAADGRVETVRRILWLLALAAAASAALAIIRSGGRPQDLSGLGDVASNRAVGSFSDPNIFATFLALALPGALALGLVGPVARRPLALTAFGVIFLGLALSLSRGGLLATAGALLVMLTWRPFRRAAFAAAAVAALLTVLGANPLSQVQQVDTVVERIVSVRYAEQSGTDSRAEVYRVTLRIIADHPVFGVGEAQYSLVAPRYGLFDPYTGFTFEHAHDIPLTVAAELGLGGLAALTWAFVQLLRILWRACVRAPRDRSLAIAVAAAFVALGLQGIVDYTVRSNVIAAVVATLAGCAVALSRPAPDRNGRISGSII